MRRKSTRIEIDIWQEKSGIHVTRKKELHTYVTDNPRSKCYHTRLFNYFKKTLQRQGLWK